MEEILYKKMAELEDRHWWFKGRRKIVEKALMKFKPARNTSVLECGCGTGGNLEVLAKFGTVVGLEPDRWAAEFARSRKIAQIYEGALPDNIGISEKFGIIALLDVLEHIEDDVAALKKLSSLMLPDGFLLVTVPAFKFLWSKHDELNHHKRRYSAKELKEVIRQAGLRPVYVTYFNFWLFPVVAFVRIISRKFLASTNQTDLWLPHTLINTVLYVIFASESIFIGKTRLPFGISLMAVARKESC